MSNPPSPRPINWPRIIVPLLALAFGALVVSGAFRSGKGAPTPPIPAASQQTAPAPAAQATNPSAPPASPAAQPAASEPGAQPPAQPAAQPAAQAATPAATPAAPPAPELLANLRAQPLTGDQPSFTTLGGLGEGDTMQIAFSAIGAGIKTLDLASYSTTTTSKDHVRAQSEFELTQPQQDGSTRTWYLTPFAALTLELKADAAAAWVPVDLTGFSAAPDGKVAFNQVWSQTAPGTFAATIVNGSNQPIARITRAYALTPKSYTIILTQRIENLTQTPLRSRWSQLAAIDVQKERGGYGLDMRRVRFGYQLPAASQGTDPTVLTQGFLWGRTESSVLGRFDKTINNYPVELPVWPNRKATDQGLRLVWTAMTSRYFAVATMPLIDPAAGDKTWTGLDQVSRLRLDNIDKQTGLPEERNPHELALKLTLADAPLPAGGSRDVSMRVYAGPLDKAAITADPVAAKVGLDGLIVYNLGGFCGPCTFELITGTLISLLRGLHNYVVFDWALAIIVLVFCVRGLLHPITKWSQIRIQRFGKQMAEVAPKQKKLQEKYGNDQLKLREETAKLWREEGVNPAGMLGCLPMFLQTPIWMALYATLYFAFELRHSPAFFGLFQAIGGQSFTFLSDLAEPDHLIEFSKGIPVPLISSMMGEIWGINVLPLILGVVFWIQQKYMTPPTTVPLTPDQEMQQKIVKYMMVFMFPVMMYNAPSGLALYFITNSVLGILESKWIRRHIEKHKLLEPKKPAPGQPAKEGFMARLQRIAEERQKMMAQAKKQPPKRKP